MAQDEEDDDDKLPPLGEGTEKFLDDAKKGKPRSFLLICKGSKVRYLAVKKKPVKSSELNEAKKQGYKGVGYFGVITGQSLNLVFNLARSDGYDKEPVKEKALKEFLEEHAGLKAKPTFAIVDSPPTIPFDEEELANPFVARFMAMDQAISQAIDAQPDRESDLLTRVTAIRGLLQDGNFNAAGPKIDELATLLAGTQVPPAPPPASAAPPPATPLPDSEMARFTSRLKALKPSIDVAIAAKDARGEEIKLRVSEAAMFARKQEFAEANRVLDDLEKRLKSAGAPPSAPPPPPDAEAARFTARLKTLKPRIDAAIAAPDGNPDIKLRISEAAVFARKKEFGPANQMLDLVEALLKPPTAPAPPTTDDAASRFTSRLKALKPRIDAAIAAPDGNPDIKLRISEAAVFARKKEFGPANQMLDQVEAMLSPLQPPAEVLTAAALEVEWQRRVTALEPRVLEAEKMRAGEAQWLTMFMTVQDLGGKGDFANAFTVLDRLEGMLNAPPDEVKAATQGVVNYAKLLLRWRDAQARAVANLTELGRQLLAHPEVQADPRFSQVQRAVAGLPNLIPTFGEELADHLDGAANGGSDAADRRKAALETITAYRNQLAAVPVLAKLGDFARKNLKAELPSAAELDAALGEVAAALVSAQ